MKKIKIAVLFSGGASALQWLLENDPNYGYTYEIVCGVSNKKDTKGEKFCKDKNINFVEFNTKLFCSNYFDYEGKLCRISEDMRNQYYSHLLSTIEFYQPDIILLSGFMLRITEPLLGYYRIINVHPADLRIKDDKGKPQYTGDDAVTMAIRAGEKSTASTIHVVEKEVDCGKIICVSEPLFVEDNTTPKEHQEKMKTTCDGPAYQKALELITSGAFVF